MPEERIEVLKNKAAEGKQRWFWHWIAANNKKIATSGEPFHSQNDAVRAAGRVNDRLATPVPIRLIEE